MKRLFICFVSIVAALLLIGCGYSKSDVDRAYDDGYQAAREELRRQIDQAYKNGWDDGAEAVRHDLNPVAVECPDCGAYFYANIEDGSFEGWA